MAISEELVFDDGVSGPADAAADAVGALADAFDDASAAATKAAAAQKESLAGVKDSAKAQASAAKDAAKLAAKAQSDEAKRIALLKKQQDQVFKDAIAKEQKQREAQAKAQKDALAKKAAADKIAAQKSIDTNFKALKLVGVAAIAAGAIAVKAIGAVGDALTKVGEVTIARDNLRATLDQVTRGRGKEALGVLDTLAKNLNQSVGDTTAQFVALRKQGLNNIQATQFIKLRADLDAVGASGADVEKNITQAIAAIKSGANADKTIKDLAKAYGAVGDGSNAAAKRAFTLGGALDNLKLAGERALAKISDAAGPAFAKFAASVSTFVDSIDGDQVTAVLEAIGSGFMDLVDAGMQVWDSLKEAFGGISGAFDQLSTNLGGDSITISDAIGAMASLVSGSIRGIGIVITNMIAVANAVVVAFNAVRSIGATVAAAIGSASAIAVSYVNSFYRAGVALVTGFIDGIVSMVDSAVQAATDLGNSASEALENVLQIGSPSKVAQRMGANFGVSFTDAMTDALPNLDHMVTAPANDTVTAVAQGGSGRAPIQVIVHVTQSNATAADIEAAVERGVESALRRAS